MNTNSEVRSAATPGEPVERGQDQAVQGAGRHSSDAAAQHSEGPWTIQRGRQRAKINSAGNWYGLATVVTRMNGSRVDDAEGLANARLIAAAPELLEELLRARRLLVSEGYVPAATMDAAIAKATQP